MPGPAPSPNARRRNLKPAVEVLPSAGRIGDPPTWPMREVSEAELDLWAELWTYPQAVMWERQRAHRSVARYARSLAASETDGRATLLTEIRHLEDRLGITPMSMLKLGWTITAVAAPEPEQSAAPAGTSARARRAAAAKKAPAKKRAAKKAPAKKRAAKKAPAKKRAAKKAVTGSRARALRATR